MANSGSTEVIDIYMAVEGAIRDGLDEFLDGTQQLGSEWWERVFYDGAVEADGAAWANVRLRLRSNRTGEEVLWIAVLRRLQDPVLGDDRVYQVRGFHRVDMDTGDMV